MNNSSQHPRRPSSRKLDYLKSLAEQTGGSFTYPATDADANREIDRLKQIRKTPVPDRRRERRQVQDDLARDRGGATRIREDELSGYGSSASWANS